jgi:hypothetical protein
MLVKKMGSRQQAVEAFLAVCDNTMLDQWIPGKPILLKSRTQ